MTITKFFTLKEQERIRYWYWGKAVWYISAKYQALKEELLTNDICIINNNQ